MTGSLATAEDVAQEAFIRWSAAERASIAAPRAWLMKVAARLSLDELRSARHRRERYVGSWLPEPALESEDAPQEASHLHAQGVSVAVLLLLRRLTPAERAVFILHDLFETPFAEIAALLRRTEPACRKLATRARARLAEEAPPSPPVPEEEGRRIAEAFFAASRDGDEAALRALLAEDAVLRADGGGIRPAALNPILGADRIARFFAGVARKRPGAAGTLLRVGRVNTLPGYVTLEADGLPQVTALEVRDGRVTAIHVVRNPGKLTRLGVPAPA
jgi:RNA polymerase sigma-70 factor, ECF subfamily